MIFNHWFLRDERAKEEYHMPLNVLKSLINAFKSFIDVFYKEE